MTRNQYIFDHYKRSLQSVVKTVKTIAKEYNMTTEEVWNVIKAEAKNR